MASSGIISPSGLSRSFDYKLRQSQNNRSDEKPWFLGVSIRGVFYMLSNPLYVTIRLSYPDGVAYHMQEKQLDPEFSDMPISKIFPPKPIKIRPSSQAAHQR